MQTVTSVLGNKIEVQPCIWGSRFHVYGEPSYTPVTGNEKARKEHGDLKEEVKRKIVKIQTTPITSKFMMPLKERLRFIDTLQRLGVSFHFEKEISNILQRVYQFDDFSSSDDLYTVATGFRLLRNEGIYIPAAGIFDKFLDKIAQPSYGYDKSSCMEDEAVDGLLSLYETSYYAIPDEDILDRAQDLTANKLRSILPELQKRNQLAQAEKIEHVLHRSIGRNCERLVARFYITAYQRELTFGESLLKFAVHDYNIRQASFQKELASVTKWRDESAAKKEVVFSRQRIIEYYVWALCVYSQPQYAMGRMMMAKLLFLMTLIDDMYDTYGAMDDLEMFTEAFSKLDPEAFPELPAYMKAIIRTTKDVYAEAELYNSTRPYVVDYLKREYERLVRAYQDDARWIRSQTTPTYEEYLDVAFITAGIRILPAMYFAGMGDVVSEEAISWALDDPIPKIIEYSVVITRFLDDLSDEKNGVDQLQTAIPVYMNHYGISDKEARMKLKNQVSEAYKQVNKCLLRGQTDTLGAPIPILKALLGHNQGNDLFNRDRDGYSCPDVLKETISTLVLEPVIP